MENDLKAILSTCEGSRSEIISIFQKIQSFFGYIPEKAILEVSKFTGVPESEVYGVATFYAQFRFTPMGKKHIMVCEGTACHIKGADQIMDGFKRYLNINEGEITQDQEYSLESVGCLGCCALAPCAMIDQDIKSNLTLKDVKRLSKRKSNKNQ